MTVNGRPAYTYSVRLHEGWDEINLIQMGKNLSYFKTRVLIMACDALNKSIDEWDLDKSVKYKLKMNFKARFKAEISQLNIDKFAEFLGDFNNKVIETLKISCEDCKIEITN